MYDVLFHPQRVAGYQVQWTRRARGAAVQMTKDLGTRWTLEKSKMLLASFWQLVKHPEVPEAGLVT